MTSHVEQQLRIHPAAERFPMLEGEELQALADDIRANGLLHPVVFFEGQLLDGRNRFQACSIAGVPVRHEMLTRCASPTAYVLSANLKRRQLTKVQLAALAVDPVILDGFRAEAEKQRREGNIRGGHEGGKGRPKVASGSRTGPKTQPRVSKAIAAAADACGVGRDSAYDMQRIQTSAPEVYEAARRGEIKTVAEARERAGLARYRNEFAAPPPAPVPSIRSAASKPSAAPRTVARISRDEKIRALHEEGLGSSEIATRLGCGVGIVQDGKQRLGLTPKTAPQSDNPLRSLVSYAIEFGDAWDLALANQGDWSRATPEQVAELTKHLKALREKTATIIRRLNKEAKGDQT